MDLLIKFGGLLLLSRRILQKGVAETEGMTSPGFCKLPWDLQVNSSILIILAKELGYIDFKQYRQFIDDTVEIKRMLSRLRQKVRAQD